MVFGLSGGFLTVEVLSTHLPFEDSLQQRSRTPSTQAVVKAVVSGR